MDYNMRTRQEIKAVAKARFGENRGQCIGVYVLFTLIIGALSSTAAGAIVLMPVFQVAASGFFAAIYRGEKRTVSDFFSGMFSDFGRKWLGVFWMELKVFLWSLLFIVPGIIKSLAYFMVPYILAEYPNVKPKDALKLSERMTNGYKGDIFVAGLSFIGWTILAGLTFGILEILFVGPYQSITFGGIYEELKRNAVENGTVRIEELEDGSAQA